MLGLAGCGQQAAPEFVYVARAAADFRVDPAPESDVLRQLQWGDRLLVLDRRRSAVFARTATAEEGWVHQSVLIAEGVKTNADLLRSYTTDYQPQGQVHAFELTNVHLEPRLDSPTLYQLQRDEPADLLRRQLVDRASTAGAKSQYVDDWQLVRLAGGQAGWILSSRAYSGIPDEIGQYAQGRRITSYFQIGSVRDPIAGIDRPTWLWTQVSRTQLPFDYDVVRLFRWSVAENAYETIWIENGLIGFLPVTIRRPGATVAADGFSLIVEESRARWRKSFSVRGGQVKMESEGPAPPALPTPVKIIGGQGEVGGTSNWFDRLFGRWRAPT